MESHQAESTAAAYITRGYGGAGVKKRAAKDDALIDYAKRVHDWQRSPNLTERKEQK